MKLLVETNFSNQAITKYPTTNAIVVAAAVSGNENTLDSSDD